MVGGRRRAVDSVRQAVIADTDNTSTYQQHRLTYNTIYVLHARLCDDYWQSRPLGGRLITRYTPSVRPSGVCAVLHAIVPVCH